MLYLNALHYRPNYPPLRGYPASPARACGRRAHHTRRYLQILMQVAVRFQPDLFQRLHRQAMKRNRSARREASLPEQVATTRPLR